MSIIELILLSIGLAMDAFAVSICKGLSVKKLKPSHGIIAGAYFGGFQALMPLLGWLLGRQFEELIKSVDHWIAFGLLVLIGAITFVISAAGVKIGNVFGSKYQSKAEFAGGAILIILGIKILIEHIFFGG